jgi:hypothetical protein
MFLSWLFQSTLRRMEVLEVMQARKQLKKIVAINFADMQDMVMSIHRRVVHTQGIIQTKRLNMQARKAHYHKDRDQLRPTDNFTPDLSNDPAEFLAEIELRVKEMQLAVMQLQEVVAAVTLPPETLLLEAGGAETLSLKAGGVAAESIYVGLIPKSKGISAPELTKSKDIVVAQKLKSSEIIARKLSTIGRMALADDPKSLIGRLQLANLNKRKNTQADAPQAEEQSPPPPARVVAAVPPFPSIVRKFEELEGAELRKEVEFHT